MGKYRGYREVNWSWRAESNRGPAHYECAALPAELRQLRKARRVVYHAGATHCNANHPAPNILSRDHEFARCGCSSRADSIEVNATGKRMARVIEPLQANRLPARFLACLLYTSPSPRDS